MSIHDAGWVECRNSSSPWYFDEWAPVMNLDPLFVEEDEALFETAPFTNHLPEDGRRISAGHGLPEDVSALVAQDAGQWLAPYHSAWATWRELQESKGAEALPAGWRLIRYMVKPLATDCRPDNVRIIMWQYVTDYSHSDTPD
jgi:hypothetical protein